MPVQPGVRKYDNRNDTCANLMILDNGFVNITQEVENDTQEPKRQGVPRVQLQHFLIGGFSFLVSPAKSDVSTTRYQSPQNGQLAEVSGRMFRG